MEHYTCSRCDKPIMRRASFKPGVYVEWFHQYTLDDTHPAENDEDA